MQNSRYLKQFLQPIESTDAIVGGEKVKLYRHLETQLISFRIEEQNKNDKDLDYKLAALFAEEQARKIINELTLRRTLIPTNSDKLHFYLVSGRQQGITVERVLQQIATTKASVA